MRFCITLILFFFMGSPNGQADTAACEIRAEVGIEASAPKTTPPAPLKLLLTRQLQTGLGEFVLLLQLKDQFVVAEATKGALRIHYPTTSGHLLHVIPNSFFPSRYTLENKGITSLLTKDTTLAYLFFPNLQTNVFGPLEFSGAKKMRSPRTKVASKPIAGPTDFWANLLPPPPPTRLFTYKEKCYGFGSIFQGTFFLFEENANEKEVGHKVIGSVSVNIPEPFHIYTFETPEGAFAFVRSEEGPYALVQLFSAPVSEK